MTNLDRQRACRVQFNDVALQDSEFIAAEARHEVALSDGGLDAICDLPQQRITDRVAERVVDILELVEIEIEHCERYRAALTGNKCHIKPFDEGSTVGERSECVQMREFEDLLVRQHEPPTRDVPRHRRTPRRLH